MIQCYICDTGHKQRLSDFYPQEVWLTSEETTKERINSILLINLPATMGCELDSDLSDVMFWILI
jgi:hypothetical protein